MNWGWKIVVIYAAFIVMTLTMVFYFMGQKVDLVAEDYYKQEIEYQERIDNISNARNQPVEVTYSVEARSVILQFPDAQIGKKPQGTIHFYRPANAEEDLEFEVNPQESGKQQIAVGSLSKGLWKIKITWDAGGEQFYDEITVTL